MIDLDQPLAAGMEGEHVEELQRRLAHLGDYEGEVDGRYGDKTETAVRQFQARSGKPEDGTIDREVWETLDREAQFAGFDPYATRPAGHDSEQVHNQYQDDVRHGQQRDPSGATQGSAAGQLSDDGQWRWDGTDWQPVDAAAHQPGVADPETRQAAGATTVPEGAQRSEDGNWWWDGTEWQPADGAQHEGGHRDARQDDQHHDAAQSSAVGQLSEDGQWRWDGTDWQPAEGQHPTAGEHAPQQPAGADPHGVTEDHAVNQQAGGQHPAGPSHTPVSELPPLDISMFDGDEFEEFREFLQQNQGAEPSAENTTT